MKIMCPSINDSFTANQIFMRFSLFFLINHRSMDSSLCMLHFLNQKSWKRNFVVRRLHAILISPIIAKCLTNIFKQSPALNSFKFVHQAHRVVIIDIYK